MSSFYATRKYLFVVPENGEIETKPFLAACQDSIIPLLDILGGTTFAFVKSDINGNIQKLTTRYNENPAKYVTVNAMVNEEIEQGTTTKTNSATDALLWLVRGLNYISMFIFNLLNDEKEEESLKPCMQDAYNKALRPHHSWVVHKAVQLAFLALPYRSTLLQQLTNGADLDTTIQDIKDYQKLLETQVDTVREYYQSNSLDVI